MIRSAFLAGLLVLADAALSDDKDKKVYTLYRNSPIDNSLRIHVATFDAEDVDQTYNFENCQIASELFQSQRGVVVQYWCEPGYFDLSWER